MAFVANLYALQQCKNFENRLRFDKVTESLKVGTLLRHSVYGNDGNPTAVLSKVDDLAMFWEVELLA